jgi:ketosteroid isomerase-like protein
MNTLYIILKSTLLCLSLVVFTCSITYGQILEPATIDLQKARIIIDSLDRKFAHHFYNGDSISLYNMYAKGASLGSKRGNEILLSWGLQIRNSIKNDTRTILYTTTSLSTDSEFLVELGTYEFRDSKGNSKYKGKYLVVWKQEDGNWKLYRDMGL